MASPRVDVIRNRRRSIRTLLIGVVAVGLDLAAPV
jgi:hypothetical protein